MTQQALPILFQDDTLIVVDKPHGLLSVPGKGPDHQDCVASRVVSTYPDALIVHRLDCHTSGVMVLARGKPAQVELSRQFHDRLTRKRYLAVVKGEPVEQQGEIDQPMRCDIDNRPRQIIDRIHGKHALTRWRLLGTSQGRSRLALEPVTGRSHQLRVHCAYMGTPIVGDRLYGVTEAAQEPRMLLHAERLEFQHPVTGEPMSVTSDCAF